MATCSNCNYWEYNRHTENVYGMGKLHGWM